MSRIPNHNPDHALALFKATKRASPLRQKSTLPEMPLSQRQTRYRLLTTESDLRRIDRDMAFEQVIDAVKTGDVEAVAWMLYDGGYDPRYRIDPNDKTLLIFAAEQGQISMVEFLAPMSDAHGVNGHGHSALALAAARGHLACCHALVAYGCEPVCDPSGVTPLMFASQFGRDACVEALAPHFDIDARDAHDRDALLFACQMGAISTVHTLLGLRLPPNLGSVQRALIYMDKLPLNFAHRDEIVSTLTNVELSRREQIELQTAAPRSAVASIPRRM